MKYPIGVQTFEKLRQEGFGYVDKTAIVYKMVHESSCYFLNRPRRFGKSLLLSTLKAYFEGRKHLFDGLAIADLEKDWNEYPVLFQSGYLTIKGHDEEFDLYKLDYPNEVVRQGFVMFLLPYYTYCYDSAQKSTRQRIHETTRV